MPKALREYGNARVAYHAARQLRPSANEWYREAGNAPLAPDDGSAKFRAAFENVILPQLQKFSPELVIVSAGFDAHFRDPLASLNLRAEDFGWVTRKLMDVADKSAGGRVVAMLEGGYDLVGLKESVAAHVAALMGT